MATSLVCGRALTHQLRETGAERAQRRTSDRETHFRHTEVSASQKCLRPLDATGHQVAVRRFSESRLEASGEVAGGHERITGQRRHVERPVVLAVHGVPGLTKPYEIFLGEGWRGHPSSFSRRRISRLASGLCVALGERNEDDTRPMMMRIVRSGSQGWR